MAPPRSHIISGVAEKQEIIHSLNVAPNKPFKEEGRKSGRYQTLVTHICMLERAFRLKPSSINLPERQASPDTCIFCIFQIIICLTLMTQITCIGPTVYCYSEVYISESGSGWKQPINCALPRGYPSPSGAFHAIPDSGFYTTEYVQLVGATNMVHFLNRFRSQICQSFLANLSCRDIVTQ